MRKEPISFNGDSDIAELTVKKDVTILPVESFTRFTNVEKITLSTEVKNVLPYAFRGCEKLKKVEVKGENKSLISVEGNLYSKNMKVIYYYAVNKKESVFKLPDGVNEIKSSAFIGCSKLVKLIIPKSVKKIKRYAIYFCLALDTVEYLGTIKEFKKIKIGYGVFKNTSVEKVICTDGEVVL